MNKYYGEKRGPSPWAGKRLYLLTTCGYRPERDADLFEEGMRQYCKHSSLAYGGIYVERDLGYHTVFMNEDKARRAQTFAKRMMETYANARGGQAHG